MLFLVPTVTMGAMTAPESTRVPRLLLGGGFFVAALVALMLLDVLPGGWRLRTLFVPQRVTDIRRRAAHREARLLDFAAEAEPAPGGTLFIGSSTIERFPVEEMLSDLRPIDRGIGDEDLARLEERFAATLDSTRPRTVVLYGGSVDARRALDDGSWTEPVELVARVEALAKEALARDGLDRVIVLGLLPERSTGKRLRDRLLAVEAGLQALADERVGIDFLPLARPPLILPSGDLSPGHSADELHLNDKGYSEVAKWLKSTFIR